MNKDIFQRVVRLNKYYQNIQGNPSITNFKKIKEYSANFYDELQELQDALSERNQEEVRDALCDLVIYIYGAFYQMGIDANDDLNTVIDSLYSRFIENEQDLQDSLDYYHKKGIKEVEVEGEFPMKILRSMSNYPDAPKGKILKSVYYKKPELKRYDTK